jgi:cold shock CspA family protein
METATETQCEHYIGRVKWFNVKSGYGFITITDGTRAGTDIFAHHSAINVESDQYRYLVQGEYIEFDLVRVNNDKYEWQASHISGIKGGQLMCETRRDVKMSKVQYRNENKERFSTQNEPKETRRIETRQVETNTHKQHDKPKEWTLVQDKPKRGRPPKKQTQT